MVTVVAVLLVFTLAVLALMRFARKPAGPQRLPAPGRGGLTNMRDPATAAAAMMYAVALAAGPIRAATEAEIDDEIRTVMGISDPTEVATFGRRIAEAIGDADKVSEALAPLWVERLTEDERRDLLAMVHRVAERAGGPKSQTAAALRRLEARLSLRSL